ncbi:MAG TPA: ATP-grasp domain-containing protein [Nitrososphaerales archaeon]|nr:ATP-grasp domain-containing protein [Nitrososphaerales archaeon]
MVEKATVLVTAAGGIIGEGIIKSLRLANTKRGAAYKVLAADASPQSAGLYRADEGFLVPGAGAPDYIDRLVKLAKENGVKAIFVGADEELAAVASAADRIRKESGAVAISNEPETIAVGSDKWRTYEFMKRNGLPCAESALPGDRERFVKEFGYPVVVKPREGHGSEGFYEAGGSDEMDHAIEAIRKGGWRPMLQEVLTEEDNEFTTGVTVGMGRKVMSSIAMRRSLKGGQTYKAFIEDFPEVRKAAENVALRLGGSGPVNVQARMAKGEPKLFEINPRLSASCPLRAAAGVNEPDILYRNFVLGEEVRTEGYERLVCLRYWNEVYLPYGDYERAKSTGEVRGSGSWIPDYF